MNSNKDPQSHLKEFLLLIKTMIAINKIIANTTIHPDIKQCIIIDLMCTPYKGLGQP
jgi:hypothetical protein